MIVNTSDYERLEAEVHALRRAVKVAAFWKTSTLLELRRTQDRLDRASPVASAAYGLVAERDDALPITATPQWQALLDALEESFRE